jgi:Uma2 family endonuclease
MADPVRKITVPRQEGPRRVLLEEEPGMTVLRWVKGPDGEMEQVELPLTPERFLNPHIGDQMTQGPRHFDAVHEIYSLLKERFRTDPHVLVLGDVKHFLATGLPAPGPDISVTRGVQVKNDARRFSFRVKKEGVRPCLILEVVSPLDSKIRRTDLQTKVEVYQRAGIAEYIIVDSTLSDLRFRLLGYRLDGAGRYQPIKPDAQERILSETTGLWFQASPDGERVFVFEHPTGRRLLNLEEQEQVAGREAGARKAAEDKARHETEARKAAEAEIERLRAEIERLRGDR